MARVQKSQYNDNFIIKGGFLLGVIFDKEKRSTKDLDTLLKDIAADKLNITYILKSIIKIDVNDDIDFELIDVIGSQQERMYEGFRAKIKLKFREEISVIYFDIDIGVEDPVTPSDVLLEIPLLFKESNMDRQELTIRAYPIETILAEKTEIILDLGIRNTRMKDFYDVHLILNSDERPNTKELYEAFEKTWNFRHQHATIDEELFEDWFFVMDEIINSQKLNETYWRNYIKDRDYANHLNLKDISQQFKHYIEELFSYYKTL